MQLSPHFGTTEFEHGAAIPPECMSIFEQFCTLVLEPIRAFIGEPMIITSGYRSGETNAAAHGIANSEHIATPEYCAADFEFAIPASGILSVRNVFDWIRKNSTLPFHQVVLEHGAMGGSVIHISYNPSKVNERKALEGATHNNSAYTGWEVVPYNPAASQAGQENA